MAALKQRLAGGYFGVSIKPASVAFIVLGGGYFGIEEERLWTPQGFIRTGKGDMGPLTKAF